VFTYGRSGKNGEDARPAAEYPHAAAGFVSGLSISIILLFEQYLKALRSTFVLEISTIITGKKKKYELSILCNKI
jgi:hypothetical protein